MHANWRRMTHDQRIIFFNEHTIHCLETFEADKVELYDVELDFLHGTRLVRAELEPQTVKLDGSNAEVIERPSRSFFLYSPKVTHGIKKIIPLENDRQSVDIVRAVFKMKISEINIVDYVKFFGLIVEGGEGPFLFISKETEIPWSDDVDEIDRERFIGALSARSNYDSISGEFSIPIDSDKKFGVGKVFRLTIPAIYAGIPFSCEMTVAPDGHIRMDEDYPIPFEGIAPTRSERNYYTVNPTDALQKYLRSKKIQVAAGAAVLGVAAMAVFVFYLCAFVGFAAGIADTLISPFFAGFGSWLNASLMNQTWLRDLILLGAIISVCLQIALLALASWAEYVSKNRPGVYDMLLTSAKAQIRVKHNTTAKRIRWIGRTTVQGLFSQIILWALILYLVPDHFGKTIIAEQAEAIALRDHVGFAFFEAINWLSRGDTPNVIASSLQNWFDLPIGTSSLGTTIKWLAAVLIPLSLTATATRYWRWSKPI